MPYMEHMGILTLTMIFHVRDGGKGPASGY